MTDKVIGTGGDYTTVNTWEADAPADLTAAGGQTWIGKCKNQEFYGGDGSGAQITLSGSTSSSSFYKHLTTDTGASFADNANKLTNALRYNASNGAAIYVDASYRRVINLSEAHSRISKLQLKQAGGGFDMRIMELSSTGRATQCIIDRTGGGLSEMVQLNGGAWAANLLLIDRTNNSGTSGLNFSYPSSGSRISACTVVKCSDRGGNGTGVKRTFGGSANPDVIDCAVFGWGTMFDVGGASWGSSSGYNATSAASAPGSNNQTSLTYADQFETVVNTNSDFRAKSSGSLDTNGTPDTTYTGDIDIVGSTRSGSTPTIGAWEVAAAGGQTVAVGQVTETDLAQAIARLKTKALGQASSTETAQPITALKTRALGQAAETDLAQTLTARKTKTLGQTTETDTAQPISHGGFQVTVNQAAETDVAQAVAWAPKHRLVGQAVEIDLAQPISRGAQIIEIAQASETDLAQAIARAKAKALGITQETDAAQPIAWAPKHRLIGQAAEVDLAQTITVVSSAAPVFPDEPFFSRTVRAQTARIGTTPNVDEHTRIGPDVSGIEKPFGPN